MSLNKNQIKHLRGLCHALNPVVMLGQKGLTQEVLDELEIALAHHELVKVKLGIDDREQRQKIADSICATSGAQCVQAIGKTISIFRRNPKKPMVELPK
jgi:RNA-binding protein